MKTSRAKRAIVRVGVVLGVGYVVAAGLLWAFQERLLFAGQRRGRGEPLPPLDGVRVDELTLRDGTRIRIAIAEPKGTPRGAIVCFGGNGESLRSGRNWVRFWADDWDLRAIYAEHPGYGESGGEPSLVSFAASAEAAAQHARELSPGLELAAFGNSLGSYCAMHAAARGLVDRVILRSAPSSIGDAGSHHYPWLPIRLLLRHDFDNLALARDVRVPVLVLHGDRDATVPIEHGRRLAEALGDHGRFVLAPGCEHNDVPMTRLGPLGAEIEAHLTGRAPR